MKIMAAKLTKEHLEQIGEYLLEKYPAIRGGGKSKSYSRDFEIEIRERIVRVEEELKNQRELILQTLNFNGKQFEQVDKRFTMMMWFTGLGLTLVTAFITGVTVLIK